MVHVHGLGAWVGLGRPLCGQGGRGGVCLATAGGSEEAGPEVATGSSPAPWSTARGPPGGSPAPPAASCQGSPVSPACWWRAWRRPCGGRI